jgi:WbqC-like protein family
MKGVILQPSYIPWRGYFHQIQKADVFVFYDDVQYDKRGWRNRNRVKTAQAPLWLTIPVRAKGCQIEKTPIHQIQISSDEPWAHKHWQTLLRAYGKSPHFKMYADELQAIYSRSWELLADFTIDLTLAAARWLGIQHTRFVRSSALNVSGVKTDRLVAILTHLGVTHYISGPSAKDYLEEEKLTAAGITLEYMVYDYPEYPQLYPPFDPQVSILDLLFMTGPQAATYIWDIPSRTAPH